MNKGATKVRAVTSLLLKINQETPVALIDSGEGPKVPTRALPSRTDRFTTHSWLSKVPGISTDSGVKI